MHCAVSGSCFKIFLLIAGTMMAAAANSQRIYELRVHSHFKAVGMDAAEGVAGASAVEIPRRKEF